MKDLLRSLKSLYGIMNAVVLIVGFLAVFGWGFVFPSVPPLASAALFVVAYVAGFLSGSFGADKRAEMETKKAQIAANSEVEKAQAAARAETEKARVAAQAEVEKANAEAKRAYETERARAEAKEEAERRRLADAAETKRLDKEKRRNDSFRSSIKTLEFEAKVLLWLIYSGGEYRVEDSVWESDMNQLLSTLQDREYIELETVGFGVTAYRATDETRALIERNEDLFKKAKGISENDLISRMF